jgi:hypothetical protein
LIKDKKAIIQSGGTAVSSKMAVTLFLASHVQPEPCTPYQQVAPLSFPLEPGQAFFHLNKQDKQK